MQPTFFINHRGPCFFMEPGPTRATWNEPESYLRGFMALLADSPRAILAISGHWEARTPTVNGGAQQASKSSAAESTSSMVRRATRR